MFSNDLLSIPLQRLFANGRMLSTVLMGLERRPRTSPTAEETTSRWVKDSTSVNTGSDMRLQIWRLGCMAILLTVDSWCSNRANGVDGVSHGAGSILDDFTLSGGTDKGCDQSLDLHEVRLQGGEVNVGLNIVDKVAERRLNVVEERVQFIQGRIKGRGDGSAGDSDSTDGAGKDESSGDSSELHFDGKFGLKE